MEREREKEERRVRTLKIRGSRRPAPGPSAEAYQYPIIRPATCIDIHGRQQLVELAGFLSPSAVCFCCFLYACVIDGGSGDCSAERH